MAYALGCSLVATLVTGVARFGYAFFAEMQAPLHELLISFFVAGALMAVSRTLMKEDMDENSASAIVYLLLITLATLMGSMWGWSVAKRMNATGTYRRIGLLALGWLFVTGITGATFVVFLTIAMIFLGTHGYDHVFCAAPPARCWPHRPCGLKSVFANSQRPSQVRSRTPNLPPLLLSRPLLRNLRDPFTAYCLLPTAYCLLPLPNLAF